MKTNPSIVPPVLASALLAGGILLSACKSGKEAGGTPGNPEVPSTTSAPQIVFLTPAEGVAVGRDYNQRVFVSIQNKGPGKAALRLRSSAFDDLPSGFVGRGTPDWEVPDTRLEIPAGEIWEAPLLVHANRAANDEYTLKLDALHEGVTQPAGTGELKVRIAAPELKLRTTWIEPTNPVDRARLRRTLRIRNIGAAVPNLSLRFEIDGKPDPQRVFINPVVEETRLVENATIDVVVGPHLYPSFTSLGGEMVLTGINQEHRVPFHAEVPEGNSVFVTLSHTTSRSSNGGKRCTNSPGSTYNTPATNGTPDDWGGGGGGGDGSAHLVLTTPFDDGSGEDPPATEEEEDEEGWTLFGYDEEGEGGEAQPDDGSGDENENENEGEPRTTDTEGEGGEDEENNADDGTFDHLDANSEEVIGGFIPPTSNGTSVVLPPPGRPAIPDLPDLPDLPGSGLRRSEVPRELKKVDVVPDDVTPSGGSRKMRKESATHADEKGRKTHVTRRRTEGGAEFLNFGFGIQPGVRKKVPVRLNYPISQPRLGPNPRPDAPALATYTKRNEAGTTVVETLDPETGRKVELSDPARNADTPVSIKIGDKVETLFREGGTIKRVALGADLAAQPADTWPAGESTGPLLAAVPGPDGTLALLTREEGGKIALRLPGSVRTFTGTDASLVRLGGKLHLALRGPDGTVEVIDPEADADSHTLPGRNYGPPTLIRTSSGGLRLYVHKPVTMAETTTGAATGTALGGNFAAEFKEGAWSAPGRVYLPDSPVAAAAVTVEFTPPFAQAHYKRMDTDLFFNGRRLATLKEMVPAGRYLFRVPTTSLHYTTSATREGARANQVVINAKGIGPGNYHLTDRCSVYALHSWTQGCFVTASADEAERLAQQNSGDISHNAHDLVIASNGAQLPRDVRPGQKTTVTIAVFNAGDQTSPALPLTVTSEGNPAGSGTIKALKPFQGAAAKLDIVIPPTWRPGTSLRLTVAAPTDNDADPDSNRLNLFLLKELQVRLAGPTAPARIDIASIPGESITEVVIPDNGEPFEVALETGRAWFRAEVPPSGDLQLEVNGSGANLVDRIDLFDHEGKVLRTDQGATPIPGSHLFIRVGLPPNAALPADTRLRIWWE